MIGIINYGAGNVNALLNQCDIIGVKARLINAPEDFIGIKRVILPGVGAFDYCRQKLNESRLIDPLLTYLQESTNRLLGICVGMQLLGETSDEGSLPGLGLIKGSVKKFVPDEVQYGIVPHMGWNTIQNTSEDRLFREIDYDKGFYFVHSFYFCCKESTNILCETNYGISFHSGIVSGNVYGVQFHPEKSHSNGTKLLKNFIEY